MTNSFYDKYKRYLSKKEELELFNRMKDGDTEARDELILAHSYLVIGIAQDYAHIVDVEDLEQEGFVALIKCLDRYNAEKGRLRKYCQLAVRQAIIRAINRMKKPIHLPDPQGKALYQLVLIKEELGKELGREPSYDDLLNDQRVIKAYKKFAKTSKRLTIDEFVRLLQFQSTNKSIDDPAFDDDSTVTTKDLIVDPNANNDIREMIFEDLNNQLLSELSKRDEYILRELGTGRSASDISREIKVTPQTISEIKLKARAKIKTMVCGNLELRNIIERFGFTVTPDDPEVEYVVDNIPDTPPEPKEFLKSTPLLA